MHDQRLDLSDEADSHMKCKACGHLISSRCENSEVRCTECGTLCTIMAIPRWSASPTTLKTFAYLVITLLAAISFNMMQSVILSSVSRDMDWSELVMSERLAAANYATDKLYLKDAAALTTLADDFEAELADLDARRASLLHHGTGSRAVSDRYYAAISTSVSRPGPVALLLLMFANTLAVISGIWSRRTKPIAVLWKAFDFITWLLPAIVLFSHATILIRSI